MKPARKIPTLLALLLTATSLIALSGCDALGDLADQEVDIDLGAAGENIPVQADNPAYQTAEVSRGGEELPDVFDVESIIIDEENTAFESGGLFEDTGTIDVFLIIDGAPAIGTEISVEGDEVTDISPERIEVGDYRGQEFDDCLESQGEDRPPVRDNYESLSEEEIREIVGDAILQENFQVSVMVCSEVTGILSIDDVTINLDF